MSSGSLGLRGGRLHRVPGSVGSKASVSPSVTAVTRLIQRICTAVIGSVRPKAIAAMIALASPPLVGSVQSITLREIVVDGAPLAHRGDDRGEIVVGQHHLGGFLGGLGALAAHGDADIGALQRRRVVDAVAGHGR